MTAGWQDARVQLAGVRDSRPADRAVQAEIAVIEAQVALGDGQPRDRRPALPVTAHGRKARRRTARQARWPRSRRPCPPGTHPALKSTMGTRYPCAAAPFGRRSDQRTYKPDQGGVMAIAAVFDFPGEPVEKYHKVFDAGDATAVATAVCTGSGINGGVRWVGCEACVIPRLLWHVTVGVADRGRYRWRHDRTVCRACRPRPA